MIVFGSWSKNACEPSACRPSNFSNGDWYQNTCIFRCAWIDSCNDAT